MSPELLLKSSTSKTAQILSHGVPCGKLEKAHSLGDTMIEILVQYNIIQKPCNKHKQL